MDWQQGKPVDLSQVLPEEHRISPKITLAQFALFGNQAYLCFLEAIRLLSLRTFLQEHRVHIRFDKLLQDVQQRKASQVLRLPAADRDQDYGVHQDGTCLQEV